MVYRLCLVALLDKKLTSFVPLNPPGSAIMATASKKD